ncbi:hypothetical protein AGMMS50293_12050 [Spirochaetia bacterium]|nr:hypothetical protein AGMMS50293_12050 [Spirochaetia bacterium]
MDYVIETIDSENLAGVIELPVSLRNMRVEVTVKPISAETRSNSSDNSAYGCLHQFANPSKIAGEKGAWERAVLKKYANS